MLEIILGTLGSLTSLIGWFGFHSILCVIIGTALCFIVTIIQWKDLTPRARKMDLVFFLIGSAVGLIFTNAPAWYVCGMLGIAIYNVIVAIYAIVMLLLLSI